MELIVAGSQQTDSALPFYKRELSGSEKEDCRFNLSPCHHSLSSFFGFQHSFIGGRQYAASFCQSSKEKCSQYVFCGFRFCMPHILEDPSAPYKQCDFIVPSSGQRCRFAVSLCIANIRFCQIHKQMRMAASIFDDIFHKENPYRGNMSLLVMAATVAHHDLECFDPSKMLEPIEEDQVSGDEEQPTKYFPVRRSHQRSVDKVQSKHKILEACDSHVQYEVKVSASRKTLKSVRGNCSGTGTNFMKRKNRHVPVAANCVDYGIEHGGKS